MEIDYSKLIIDDESNEEKKAKAGVIEISFNEIIETGPMEGYMSDDFSIEITNKSFVSLEEIEAYNKELVKLMLLN